MLDEGEEGEMRAVEEEGGGRVGVDLLRGGGCVDGEWQRRALWQRLLQDSHGGEHLVLRKKTAPSPHRRQYRPPVLRPAAAVLEAPSLMPPLQTCDISNPKAPRHRLRILTAKHLPG